MVSWLTLLLALRLALCLQLPTQKLSKPRLQSPIDPTFESPTQPSRVPSIVLIAGFEAFNVQLYRKAASAVASKLSGDVRVVIFTDVDIENRPDDVQRELAAATVLFTSLLFDYAQISWLRARIADIPYRFSFESALELMGETKVGSFEMKGGATMGPPPAIKALLSQFSSAKEEDKMTGYLKFLKVGPKLLSLLPSDKFTDLRTWLTVYSYWNEGGFENVSSMLLLIAKELKLLSASASKSIVVAPVRETPTCAFYHPSLDVFVKSPKEYVAWYERTHPWVTDATPRVGLLLYRKHVITGQEYIGNLVRLMESEGVMPVPVFISGVEAHTVVRDLFTTHHQQQSVVASIRDDLDLARVDVFVNTIGFPLVGGPAGSMEGGRQIEVARDILTSKNVPYIVSAPLLIQDLDSWRRDGVQGLQTVVLYALPELDGAIETVVLGGLVDGERITVLPERVRKLVRRLNAWVRLQKAEPKDRKISILVYGFPPNTGAVGTAALLNVDKSLRNTLTQLQASGYDIGSCDPSNIPDDAIVSALRSLYQEGVSGKGAAKAATLVQGLVNLPGAEVVGREVGYAELKQWLGKTMSARLEKQWGELESYQGIASVGSGKFGVVGVQLGNVFIGMQPLLGIEGDPMRLLFDRDLCPHPQYAAFYLWLQKEHKTDALIHFGMHGTVEWLPGSPLGGTPESWPDILLGDTPNLYIYAANNPSESILAKRRGYSTIVSYNVPPYARAGLYKDLKSARDLLLEYRTERSPTAIPLIAVLLEKMELYQDVPFRPVSASTDASLQGVYSDDGILTPTFAEELLAGDKADAFVHAFDEFSSRMWDYLLELENRIFSEGLHEIGSELTPRKVFGYLQAVFSSETTSLSDFTLSTIAKEVVESTTDFRVLKKATLLDSLASSMLPQSPVRMKPFEEVEELELTMRGHQLPSSTSSLFDEDAQFQLHLLRHKGFRAASRFGYLKFKSQWGDADSEDEISVMKAVGAVGIDAQGRLLSGIDKSALKSALGLAKTLVKYANEELRSVLKGLNGEYIAAAPGGDLIRDGVSVLPTGRNIHALDPFRIPSPVALERGKKIAEQLIADYKLKNGVYPETMAVTLWGLDTIKTKGESIGILLGLLGAEPVRESTGRIVGFALLPLSSLGRPRIDVVASLSGIFRDTFGNVLDLLDDLFEAVALAKDEGEELNFVKKHTIAMAATGEERPFSRLFSNPPGDYGSMINERIGSGDWKTSEELGETWESKNSFSYGRRGEKGISRRSLLKSLLNSTDSVVQEIDSVEYGLTDIQEYYANTGALKTAAENNRVGKAAVSVNVVETFDKKARARDLNDTLRIEYRSKLLNPKWADEMVKQGTGGGYEISQRMTAMIGWAATTGFSEKWVYDGAADTYVFDSKRAEDLRKSNPEAFRNVLRRMLEANGRGFWTPDDGVRERLQEMYSEVEDEIEGVF